MDILLFCARTGVLPRRPLVEQFHFCEDAFATKKHAERYQQDSETAVTRWTRDIAFDYELAMSYWPELAPSLEQTLKNARQIVHVNIMNQTQAMDVACFLASYYHALLLSYDDDWICDASGASLW